MISVGRMHMKNFPFFAIVITIIQQDFTEQLRIWKKHMKWEQENYIIWKCQEKNILRFLKKFLDIFNQPISFIFIIMIFHNWEFARKKIMPFYICNPKFMLHKK